ncbi:hypothetical protein [Porticoccus sp.]|uniref:hypothetical protein n=1 Tax=Porticoccus sp. TaxID=2024853 RepID=UPI000C68F899|nr:hypothetical protein [Porticoccus sp.]MAZ70402.1 hypothetical protein [Porticoccus sp.]|tara:strand:- start:6361 stop:7005 length:645 start_codon:yes stop_codon:yes gene_type:complete
MVNRNVNTYEENDTRLEAALNEIATGAGVLRELLGDVGECLDAGSHKGLSAKILAAETLVAKIGWIADAEALSVCGSQAFGDAARWFVSPAYREAKAPGAEVGVEKAGLRQTRAIGSDDNHLPDRALQKLENMERDYLSVQHCVSAVRSFADELHDASYQDEPPELFSEFAGIRVQAISRLAQLALNDIDRIDMCARELRGLPDPMAEAMKAAS